MGYPSGFSPQASRNPTDVIFLKQPNRSDARGSGVEAGLRVLQSHSTECEYWDVCLTCFVKLREASRLRTRDILLLEYGSIHSQGCAIGAGPRDFRCGVT